MMDETQKNEFEGKEEQKVSTEQKKEKKNGLCPARQLQCRPA